MILTKTAKRILDLNRWINITTSGNVKTPLIKADLSDTVSKYLAYDTAYMCFSQCMLRYSNQMPNVPSSVSTMSNGIHYNVGGYGSLLFGDGTTAATENDTWLESFKSVNASLSSRYSYCSIDDGVFYIDVSFIVTNNGATDMTFQEIGFASSIYGHDISNTYGTYSDYGSGYDIGVLMWRHVFDSPVTIHSTESKQIVLRFIYQEDQNLYGDVTQFQMGNIN